MSNKQRDEYGRIMKGQIASFRERPVFVFGAGERCGSTLLQRYLCSHPEIFLWGGQHGALSELFKFWETALDHSLSHSYVADSFVKSGVQEFIANLCPQKESVNNAVRVALQTLFGGYAERWGCKEIRCGVQVAEMLVDLFHECSVIFVVRDINDCISSTMRWGYDAAAATEVARSWARLANGFTQRSERLVARSIVIRYEDFIENPIKYSGQIGELLKVNYRDFDGDVLNVRVSDHVNIEQLDKPSPRETVEIPPEIVTLLEESEFRKLRVAYGYVG